MERHSASALTSPDFVKLVAAYVIAAKWVSDPVKLDFVFAKAVRSRKPHLLEIITDTNANVSAHG